MSNKDLPQDQERQENVPASLVSSGHSDDNPEDGNARNDILYGRAVKPQSSVQRSSVEVRFAEHSGPLPHPAILAGYEAILPGTADRIITMAEKQQAHRIEIEGKTVASNNMRSQQGLYAATGITICCIVAACYFAFLGYLGDATLLFGTTLVSLVGIFVTGKAQQKRDLEAKADAIPDGESLPVSSSDQGTTIAQAPPNQTDEAR